jgi:UrcA family protein
MIRPILSAIAVVAALTAVTPAFAQETVSIKVSYSDLNLNSTAGANIFHQRLQNAVEDICGRPDWRDLAGANAVRKCQRDTWESAAQGERQAMAQAHGSTQLAIAAADLPAR